jgi:hypothetical protein
MEPHRGRGVLKVGLLAAALLLALGPSAAWACSVSGALLETLESPPAGVGGRGPLDAGTYPDGLGIRLAQATEIGVFTGNCPTLVGPVEVHAQSRVNVQVDANGDPVLGPMGTPVLLSGPITGGFKVTAATGVVRATLDGTLDFAPVNFGYPFVNVGGSWKTKGAGGITGSFSGVALIPIPNDLLPPPAPPSPTGWSYIDVTGALGNQGSPVALTADQFTEHGSPMAMFLVTLTTQ